MGHFPSRVFSFLAAMAVLFAGSAHGSGMHEHEGHGDEPTLTKHHAESLFLVTEKKGKSQAVKVVFDYEKGRTP